MLERDHEIGALRWCDVLWCIRFGREEAVRCGTEPGRRRGIGSLDVMLSGWSNPERRDSEHPPDPAIVRETSEKRSVAGLDRTCAQFIVRELDAPMQDAAWQLYSMAQIYVCVIAQDDAAKTGERQCKSIWVRLATLAPDTTP